MGKKYPKSTEKYRKSTEKVPENIKKVIKISFFPG